ncbi:MAG: asparagine synthase-related protein [bacterium]
MLFERNGSQLSTQDTIRVSQTRHGDTLALCLSLGESSSINLDLYAKRLKESKQPCFEAIFDLASALPITDAIILFFNDKSAVVVRGASANFGLYRESGAGKAKLATYLPPPTDAPLSKKGLWHCVASGLQQGCYEPNLTLYTPFRDWRRLRRGAITAINPEGKIQAETPIHYNHRHSGTEDPATMLEVALKRFSKSTFHNHHLLVEVSGGYDSTLAALSAQDDVKSWDGVSIDYPYYEFRFEKEAQQAAAKSLSIKNHYWIDGSKFGSYTRSDWSPKTNEPCLGATGIERTRLVAETAQKAGAKQILVGTGGDQLFGSDLNTPEPFYYKFSRRFITRAGLPVFNDAQSSLRSEAVWTDRTIGTYIDPAPFYEQVLRDFGVQFVSPFADRKILRIALLWGEIKKKDSLSLSNKDVMRFLPDIRLPPEISNRHGKAPYDGVWSRSYMSNGKHIGELFSLIEPIFEKIGINNKWLFQQLDSLVKCSTDQDQEVIISYAIAKWFNEWNVEKLTDITID